MPICGCESWKFPPSLFIWQEYNSGWNCPGRHKVGALESSLSVLLFTAISLLLYQPYVSARHVNKTELWIWSCLLDWTGARSSISSKKIIESHLRGLSNNKHWCCSDSPTHFLRWSASFLIKRLFSCHLGYARQCQWKSSAEAEAGPVVPRYLTSKALLASLLLLKIGIFVEKYASSTCRTDPEHWWKCSACIEYYFFLSGINLKRTFYNL